MLASSTGLRSPQFWCWATLVVVRPPGLCARMRTKEVTRENLSISIRFPPTLADISGSGSAWKVSASPVGARFRPVLRLRRDARSHGADVDLDRAPTKSPRPSTRRSSIVQAFECRQRARKVSEPKPITTFRTFNALVIACAIAAGCAMQHGPEGVAYSTPSGSVGVTSSDAGRFTFRRLCNPRRRRQEKRGNTP